MNGAQFKLYVHGNTMSGNGAAPKSALALLNVTPLEDVVWDGVENPDGEGGGICLGDKPPLFRNFAGFPGIGEPSLHSHLKPSATLVAPVQEGIPWLGLRVFPELVRLTAGARRRMARTLRASGRRASQTPGADEDEAPRAAGVAGHGALADSLGLRRDLLAAIPLPPGFDWVQTPVYREGR